MLTLFTDTDTDITPEIAKEYGYKLISMPYSIDAKTIWPYEDFDVFDSHAFYDSLRNGVLPTTGGISAERVEAFQDGFDKTFGAGAVLPAVNIVAPKQFKVDLPSVSIKVDPKQADLLETRVIDGRSYLLIPIEGDIAVNGQPVFPAKS